MRISENMWGFLEYHPRGGQDHPWRSDGKLIQLMDQQVGICASVHLITRKGQRAKFNGGEGGESNCFIKMAFRAKLYRFQILQ